MIGEVIARLALVVVLAQAPEPTVAVILGQADSGTVVMKVSEARALLEMIDQFREPYRTRLHAALVAALGTLPDSKPAHSFTSAEFERKRWQRQPAQGQP